MHTRPDLLTDIEREQIAAIQARLQGSRPADRPLMLLQHALEDALSGAMAIDSGSFGLACTPLEDAAKSVRRHVANF